MDQEGCIYCLIIPVSLSAKPCSDQVLLVVCKNNKFIASGFLPLFLPLIYLSSLKFNAL